MTIDERKQFVSELRRFADNADDFLGSCDASELEGILYDTFYYMFKSADIIEQLSDELDATNQKLNMAIDDIRFMGRYNPYCVICSYADIGYDKAPCNCCRRGNIENHWCWRGEHDTKEELC